MKNHFNRAFILRAWHIAAFALALLLTLSTTVIVLARPTQAGSALFPAGTVRLARIASTALVFVPADNNFTTVADLKIKIPAGKTADLLASFNAEGFYDATGSGGIYCNGHFMIDGQILEPDSEDGMRVVDSQVYAVGHPTIQQQGATGVPLASGKHHLLYQLRCNINELEVDDRSLMAWVNLR